MAAADEQHVILRAREGNDAAFRILVERYMKQTYNIAFGFVNDHDDAEDLAQEAFVRVYQSLRTFRGDSEFSTWLYRIVMNLSLNKIRQKKHKVQREVQLVDHTPLHNGISTMPPSQPDLTMHIERALLQLSTLQRSVVVLRHINGLSTKQTSAVLRCSEGTVKTHLHRGLKKMRKLLHYLKDEEL